MYALGRAYYKTLRISLRIFHKHNKQERESKIEREREKKETNKDERNQSISMPSKVHQFVLGFQGSFIIHKFDLVTSVDLAI